MNSIPDVMDMAHDKSVLDLRFNVSVNDFVSIMVTDISSFTSSFPSWSLYLAILLTMENTTWYKYLDHEVLVRVGSGYVKTTYRKIMILYLHTNIGMPIYDPKHKDYFKELGSALGVTGSMTSALVAY